MGPDQPGSVYGPAPDGHGVGCGLASGMSPIRDPRANYDNGLADEAEIGKPSGTRRVGWPIVIRADRCERSG